MSKSSIKIIFFGTSYFAVSALEILVKEGYAIIAVITNPDEPTGRKRILTPPPVKAVAEKYGIKILQPESLRNNLSLVSCLLSLRADVGIVIAYGKIIPSEIINLPKHGMLNIHPSLLPKYRGPSPIQSAILNGEKETGITIMKIDEEIDHGPILKMQNLKIKNQNYKELETELSKLGAELLIEVLPDYLAGKITPQPQNHAEATFTKMIKTEDGRIGEKDTAERAYNKIRALNPEPGTYINIKNGDKNFRLKILNAELPASPENQPKTGILFIRDRTLMLGLKDGCIKLTQVQPEGKNPMSGEDFIKGYRHLLSDR